MTVKLGVNIDHVATLRQARGTSYPSVIEAAQIAVDAGADGITVHLREDRRHIQLHDVEALKDMLVVPLNLEMAATGEMRDIAADIIPAEVCLVPERRQELTTEGGLDALNNIAYLQEFCQSLQAQRIAVSLFIDAVPEQIDAAIEIGADIVELHTGQYADASSSNERDKELVKLTDVTAYAHGLGLIVNAGHGLNYDNVQDIAAIPQINCLNIGHAIVAQAIKTGLFAAVGDMLALTRVESVLAKNS